MADSANPKTDSDKGLFPFTPAKRNSLGPDSCSRLADSHGQHSDPSEQQQIRVGFWHRAQYHVVKTGIVSTGYELSVDLKPSNVSQDRLKLYGSWCDS